jgi:hypothetical protein
MKNSVVLTLASMLAIGTATPSFANEATNNFASFLGSTAAMLVDVPQGILVDSLWHMPVRTTHKLAEAFGDEKGFEQNVVGAMLGIPFGVVYGIPEGALRGAKHGLGSGWEKPFSTDSFLVVNYEEK